MMTLLRKYVLRIILSAHGLPSTVFKTLYFKLIFKLNVKDSSLIEDCNEPHEYQAESNCLHRWNQQRVNNGRKPTNIRRLALFKIDHLNPSIYATIYQHLNHEWTFYMLFIMQTHPCSVHPLTPHFYIEKLGFKGVYIFSHFCSKT